MCDAENTNILLFRFEDLICRSWLLTLNEPIQFPVSV